MYKLKVIGLGPGNPKYILPIATEEIQKSKVILCGERHLESFSSENKKLLVIGREKKLMELIEEIKKIYKDEQVAVIVSGDTGFYSLLNLLRRNIPEEDLEVIPGISSIQYMYARLKRTWQDSKIASIHGRDQDFIKYIRENRSVGLLLDGEHNINYIAKNLKAENIKNKVLYLGEELSYPEEKITKLSVDEALVFKAKTDLAVAVIEDDDN